MMRRTVVSVRLSFCPVLLRRTNYGLFHPNFSVLFSRPDPAGLLSGTPEAAKPRVLIASLFFYYWGEQTYVAIMFLSTAIDYTHGLLVERCKAKGNDKAPAWRCRVGHL